MRTENQRRDIGSLALADAALGGLLIQIAEMVEDANYPDPPRRIDPGMTTGQAARIIDQQMARDPGVFPERFGEWLTEVFEATDVRNRVLHAVAVNTCAQCGTATLFRHPRSGQQVDRTAEAVHAVTTHAEDLHQQGITHSHAVAGRVNARIEATARTAAEETNEIQDPPQVSAHRPEYVCSTCHPNGRGSITLAVGTAVEVWPREKFQMLKEELAKPHAERDYERWHR